MLLMLWIIVPLCETISQIAMKLTSSALEGSPFDAQWFSLAARQPWIWLSFIADIVGFLAWIGILRRTKLSVAFPLTAICYVTVELAGHFIFHEPTSPGQAFGICLIMSGILLIGCQRQDTA